MVVTEFHPQNPSVFQDELFAIEPESTLEQVHNPDDTQRIVRASSGVNIRYEKTYNRLTMLTMKSGKFFWAGPGKLRQIGILSKNIADVGNRLRFG